MSQYTELKSRADKADGKIAALETDVKNLKRRRPAGTPARIHSVVSGDNLSAIAQRYYGDASKWRQIYAANVGVIGPNENLLRVGQQLVIP